jgi:hypothetical protein
MFAMRRNKQASSSRDLSGVRAGRSFFPFLQKEGEERLTAPAAANAIKKHGLEPG